MHKALHQELKEADIGGPRPRPRPCRL